MSAKAMRKPCHVEKPRKNSMLQRASGVRRQFVVGFTRSAGTDCQTYDAIDEEDSLPSCRLFRNLGNVDEIYLNAWLVQRLGSLSRGK
jgi:hypothetical protein